VGEEVFGRGANGGDDGVEVAGRVWGSGNGYLRGFEEVGMREVMCICAVGRVLEEYKKIPVMVNHIYDGIFWLTPTDCYSNLKIGEVYFSLGESDPIYLPPSPTT